MLHGALVVRTRKEHEEVKHKTDDIQAVRTGQVRVTFTNKELMVWGETCSVLAKFLERISFRDWVERNAPIEEHSSNARGIYPKWLSLLLTSVTGDTRFSDLKSWMHGHNH